MILRFHLILTFFILFSLSAKAQSDMEDVVYLKNGGVTRGVILEIIPDSTLKIQTRDKSIFVYTFKEIMKVVKENVAEKKAEEKVEEKVKDPYKSEIEYVEIAPAVAPTPKEEYKVSGYHGIIKLGPLSLSTLSFNFINGYQFNPYLLLGLGVGLDTYNRIGTSILENEDPIFGSQNSTKRTSYFLPIYMDFRFHVSKSKATFFTYFNVGYSPYLGGKGSLDTIYNPNVNYNNSSSDVYIVTKGGSFFGPGIGLKVFISKNIGVVADFGLKFQTYEATRYKAEEIYNSYNYTSTYVYKNAGVYNKLAVSPMINFGISF